MLGIGLVDRHDEEARDAAVDSLISRVFLKSNMLITRACGRS